MKYEFTPSKYFFTFGPNPPVLEISSGDTVVTTTVDARGFDSFGTLVPEEKTQRSKNTIFRNRNPLVGPFFIRGADIGDTLAVSIERIVLNRETAWSRVQPNFGSFTEEELGKKLLLNEPLEERYFQWTLDLKNNIGIIELPRSRKKKLEIPLHPFIGSIGVAPRFGRIETSLTPGEYGGNMDSPETKEGTTMYFPVFVKGAYLSFGDVHAAQGDGEICGVALETSAEVTLRINVVKGKIIDWPRLEDKEYIMVAGNSKPLMEAFKIAHVELIDWLVSEYGFEKWEALQILSQVGTCRVGNVVDPKYNVVAKFPKKYLP
ncbi:MAG: hypothetical protein QG670_2019 [Thermoproteota archaeon]|nr:hypothetical protein [Thermoproteota archaeon]